MSVSSSSVAEVLAKHVTLELECIDRMYCNVYVPRLQSPGLIATFFRDHRGELFASSALMAPMSRAFVAALHAFAAEGGLELVRFRHGERKEDVAAARLASFRGEEGVLFIGVAQEKTRTFRTERRHNPMTGKPYPWIVPSSAMVNQYYLYALDRDFGLFFLKFSSYFPYTGRLCFNGHEWLKRQALRAGIALEPLENGVASCADPRRLQRLADGLTAEKIERFARKWLARVPQPFSAADRAAGYDYELSVLQAEFSLTQVLDTPLSGRLFFEQVIRENLDLGRPDQVSLIFERRILRRGRHPTPGRFRTRVLTEGVRPSLYVDYRSSRIKQYHKEGRALRTETTVNDAGDFGIGKRLSNLAALRQVGFQANRRLLDVQRISHDCTIGEEAFRRLTNPVTRGSQRASALRPGSERTQARSSARSSRSACCHGASPPPTCARILRRCSVLTPRRSRPAASPMSCGACACRASSSAFRAPTATASARAGCARRCSCCAPTPASSDLVSPRSPLRFPDPHGCELASMPSTTPSRVTSKRSTLPSNKLDSHGSTCDAQGP